jgi:hypothetical protein
MNKIEAGVLSGAVGGVLFDALMRALPVHAADGRVLSMIDYVGAAIRPSDPWIGWLVYVLYGVVIGGIFGYVFHERALGAGTGALWGIVYAVAWWVIACLALFPALIGSLPFAQMTREALRQVAMPLLAGHVVYGVVLGAAFGWISRAMSGPRPHQGSHVARNAAR